MSTEKTKQNKTKQNKRVNEQNKSDVDEWPWGRENYAENSCVSLVRRWPCRENKTLLQGGLMLQP
jgi:hypothetical protein